ncbi:MAG: DUF2269 domain-containing protein [Parasphingorhabdus sp.]
MSVTILFAQWLHIIGATVLIGTGAGIAFFMVMAHRTRDAKLIAHVLDTVVIADFLFTALAVIVQPITGFWLAYLLGWPIMTPWIIWSLVLYIFIGFCWLPVVWLQIRLRNLARAAARKQEALTSQYYQLFKTWFTLGIPAFSAILVIVWLMLAKTPF